MCSFGIRNVVEFYAATEGLGILFINSKDGKGAGAIGQHGLLMRLLSRGRSKIIKIDPITQEPYRNKQGFCVQVLCPLHKGELLPNPIIVCTWWIWWTYCTLWWSWFDAVYWILWKQERNQQENLTWCIHQRWCVSISILLHLSYASLYSSCFH